MRLIRHLVWFDARALWVPLTVWSLFLLVEGALFYIGPTETQALTEFGRLSLTVGMSIIRIAGAVIIMAMLVHADPVVGTTAFWMSRPIPRATLFASKAISAVLWMIVLPGLITAAVLLSLGMAAGAAVTGGLTTTYEQVAVLLAAVTFATVTADLVQFIVAGVIALAIGSVANQTLLPMAAKAWPDAVELIARAGLGRAALVLACSAAAYQYLTRRRAVSVGMLAGALMLASVASRATGWDDYSSNVPLRAATEVPDSAVVLTSETAAQINSRESRYLSSRARYMREVRIPLTRSLEPKDLIFRLDRIMSMLELPDHSLVGFNVRWPAVSDTRTRRPATQDDAPYPAIRPILDGATIILPPRETVSAELIRATQLPEEQYLRFVGQPATLRAEVSLIAYRPRIGLTVRLAPGSTARVRGGAVFSIESVTTTPKEIVVGLRQTALDDNYRWYLSGPRYYLLRNRQLGTAVVLSGSRNSRSARYNTIFSNRSATTVLSDMAFLRGTDAAGRVVLDDAWLKDAELVMIEADAIGTVTRPLVVENLVLGNSAKPGTGTEAPAK